jgi:type I restriction enzyme, S subunit
VSVPKVVLSEVAEVRLGRQRSPKNHAGTHMRPYVRAANVGWSGWKLDDVKAMNYTEREMDTYRLQPGDLLLGEASGSATEVGKPALWEGQIDDCAFQNTLIRVRPSAAADSRYLLRYFGYCASTGEFARSARGVGIFHLGSKTLADWKVPLPPIEEQRRIAAVLDAADELRAKRREALAKLDTLTQAIFIDMFGNVFDPRQGDRETVALGELMAKRRGSVDPRSAPETVFDLYSIPAYDAGESELVRGAEIGSSKPRVEPGDVLLSRIVPHIRRCWVVGETRGHPQVGSGEWIIFRQEGVVPSFLQAALLSDTFHPRFLQTVAGVGGSLLRARPAHVAEIRIALPPRDRQAKFARRAAAVTRATSVAAEAAVGLDGLFASLQQRAFRGEL